MKNIEFDGEIIQIPDNLAVKGERGAQGAQDPLYISFSKRHQKKVLKNAVPPVPPVPFTRQNISSQNSSDAKVHPINTVNGRDYEPLKKSAKSSIGVYIGDAVPPVPPTKKLDEWYNANFISGSELIRAVDGINAWNADVLRRNNKEKTEEKKKENEIKETWLELKM